MSKVTHQSSGSVTSIASSETSDEVLNNVNNSDLTRRSSTVSLSSSKKDSKKDERPPWRPAVAAGVALIPKVDKKALLKAKLLDASRRALRTVRLVPMATQTDPPRTKLCKEVCSDTSDLVLVADVGILTDGNMVVKDDKEGKLVMTLSVSQMTDPPIIVDAVTQTALPRSPIAVNRFLKSTPAAVQTPKDSKLGREEQLLNQIEELIQKEAEHIESSNKTDDSDSDATVSADSLFQKQAPPVKKFYLHPKKKPTQSYWNNIDFSDDEDSFPQLPRRTVNPAPANVGHLQDFRNIIIGQRLQNMRLSPIPPRVRRPNKKIVTWSEDQHKVVSKLISEANALQDIFDEVSILLGPDMNVHDVHIADCKLPPSKWDTLLSESCDRLEAQLNSYEPLDVRELRKEMSESF